MGGYICGGGGSIFELQLIPVLSLLARLGDGFIHDSMISALSDL
jgi:hypothetical protein